MGVHLLQVTCMLCCCVLGDINIQALPCKMLPGACLLGSSWLTIAWLTTLFNPETRSDWEFGIGKVRDTVML